MPEIEASPLNQTDKKVKPKLNTKLLKDFQRAREAAVPLLVIQTADQAATMRQIVEAYKDECPLIRWDVSDGLVAMNETGAESLQKCTLPMAADPPYEHIKVGLKFERYTIFFVLNGNLFMGGETVDRAAFTQAIWNLRDKYKNYNQERILVILCSDIQLPSQVKQDFILLDDPLPESEEIWKIAESIYKAANVDVPKDEITRDKITQTCTGLSAFAVEQVYATSITKKGMDMEKLWSQKKKQVEQCAGLSVYRGHETFKDIEGIPTAKEFLTRLMNGKDRPTELVFMDELEKMFAGAVLGDNTGASQDQHSEFLKWSQNNKIPALMFVGHPGCSKSFLAKCAAGEFGVPMVEIDIGALKGSLLGQTGEQTRLAFKTVLAIGKPLLIATSNSMGILPPELKRRFKLGTWFFDLPSEQERRAVWNLYIKKYQLNQQQLPNDDEWTPAEIEVCCEVAWRLDCSLIDASKFVVPVAKSDPEKVKMLRQVAHNRFNSASYPGTYQYKKIEWMDEEISQRAVSLSGKVGEA
jgi:ATPase family associated with various cellular activities (AAA)